MELRRTQNRVRSGRGGGEEWRGGEGDGSELRAPQPRYVGREGTDTGYDSDSRSVFGSYDPEVRGTRIFEEEEEEEGEMEIVSRGLSTDRTPQTITFDRQRPPRRTSDTSSVPLPLKHRASAASHPVSPLSKSQQLPTPPLGIGPPPQRSYDDELRPPTPTLRRSQSTEHSVAYQPSAYPSRSQQQQQQYDPRGDGKDRDGRGQQQQQHRGGRGGHPRWDGRGDRDGERDRDLDFPPSPQGMYDYSIPQRSTGDTYYQQHQEPESYYRNNRGGRAMNPRDHYFPASQSQQFPLPPTRDRYGSLPSPHPSPPELYDEGLPTPTASSGSNFGQQQGVVARIQREEAALPASFFGAPSTGAMAMRGQRSADPRFPGHRSDSFYTASEDGMGTGGGAAAMSFTSSRAEPEFFKGTIHNLPNLKDGTRVDGKTSLPITFIQRDLDHSISSLISKDVFAELLDDPMGRFRFREWLSREGKPQSSSLLAFYQDSKAYLKIMDEFKSLGLAIHESFLAPSSVKEIDVNNESKEDSLLALREAHRLKTPFSKAATQAFDTLYATEFSAFIKKKITDQARVRLGMFTAQRERGDLGDVFCLTNPRLPDHPIVMCSDGFIRLTGYPRNQLVGRNCRFLQGPSTNPESVQNLRNALNAGVPSCELLLNYKADGTAFWNCLSMIPLKTSNGRVDYVIGGQINISGALASRQSLSFLVGASATDSTMSSVEDRHAIELAKSGNSDLELSSEVISAVERQIGHQSHLRAKESLGPGERPGGAVAAGLVQDNDTAERVGGFGSTSPAGISKFFSRLRGKTTLPGVFSAEGQRISGAEGMLGTHALPLDEQMAKFTEVYSKIFLFRTKKREVIFVTPCLSPISDSPSPLPRRCTPHHSCTKTSPTYSVSPPVEKPQNSRRTSGRSFKPKRLTLFEEESDSRARSEERDQLLFPMLLPRKESESPSD
ncbi:hypothetical protein BDY24DRAFT_350325 [Mrakia frigida]|uniref:uncharacterized protein n=1 Tax=Mrakia frigida TaxID=29902 RepID=UPI003FCC001D